MSYDEMQHGGFQHRNARRPKRGEEKVIAAVRKTTCLTADGGDY